MAPMPGKGDKNREDATELDYVDRGLNSFHEIGHVCK